MSIRYNEELDPNEGPSFTEFMVLATLFALILLLIPAGVFAWNWPVWLLGVLMFIDLGLLFLVSMTAVFLLRVFFADRRRGRGRQIGVAKGPTVGVSTAAAEEPPSGAVADAGDPRDPAAPGNDAAATDPASPPTDARSSA
jgi:hypothetical protein